MNNKTILVRDITSLSEARYCAGMLVDFICFEFNPNSENYLLDSKRTEITEWLSGAKLLGTFRNGSLSEIKTTLENYRLDGFLFENEQANYVNAILTDHKFLEIDSNTDLKRVSDDVYTLSNTMIDREKHLLGYDFSNPFNSPNSHGFAFNGSQEQRPGYNAYDDLMDAFEVIENI